MMAASHCVTEFAVPVPVAVQSNPCFEAARSFCLNKQIKWPILCFVESAN
jgi:hypothetical protein